ncbi:helix-turn-helix domain-containing protein [Pseudonocardia sp. ICBG601]|uniref:helix-turn-helix domain-containing protein n=1 Tax=Pseudonocardia sp. ICBG601 TaxID=2846759 RepID=UPI001CF6E842|nr:helix-turn-helix domain-containing protein [Pseudonocardia sp. ICBG601]
MSGPQVGAVVRALRRERRATLADVAAASGLSVPFLSQVENGRAAPSMRSLQALAAALDTTAVALLSAAEEAGRVDVVAPEDNAIADGAGRVRTLVRGDRHLHALEFTGSTGRAGDSFRHPHDELLYVVRGTARVWAGDEEFELAAGAALYCSAGVDHRWTALTDDTTVLLVGINDRARVSLPAGPPRAADRP